MLYAQVYVPALRQMIFSGGDHMPSGSYTAESNDTSPVTEAPGRVSDPAMTCTLNAAAVDSVTDAIMEKFRRLPLLLLPRLNVCPVAARSLRMLSNACPRLTEAFVVPRGMTLPLVPSPVDACGIRARDRPRRSDPGVFGSQASPVAGVSMVEP